MTKHIRLLVGIIGGVWVWGFASFMIYVLYLPHIHQPIADAVVVLTGRRGRIAEGNNVVQQGLAHKLFISGVHKKVRHADLSAAHITPEGIGYKARNTAQNAEEIALWKAQYGWNTIRLVTDAVHMPRSLLHVRSICPDLQVIPHAIYPKVSFSTYISEFHKLAYNVIMKALGFPCAISLLPQE